MLSDCPLGDSTPRETPSTDRPEAATWAGSRAPPRAGTRDGLSMTKPHKFRFGAYRLDTAARELRRDGELLPLPRRVFDALAHLVEQRERAVSHDELIATLWGRTHVANSQVSQLIMQGRRAIGGDRNTPGQVRTVPGFRYRWTGAT